jgi:two-component sensor histidine kinase
VPHAEAAVTSRETWLGPGCTECDGPANEYDFRQLRHHTKNVLQQILLRIEHAHDLKVTVGGSRLLADLQHRILLSAQISDALFGITRSPASMSERLRVLSESTIRMFADGTQVIRPDVTVTGDCPKPLQQLVLRVAHEFVANAVKHGMHARIVGTISVHLVTGIDGCTALVVADDGWGLYGSTDAGDGMKIAGDLAASAGGTISLQRTHVTVAQLELPSPRAQRGVCDRSTRSGFEVTGEREGG